MSIAIQAPIPTVRHGGRTLIDVAMDVTLYVVELDVSGLDYILESYRQLAPVGAWRWFKIRENPIWDRVERPIQPASLAYGSDPLGFLDSVRARIRDGRPVELRIWDREEERSWNFSCFRHFSDEGGCHSFYRVLAPWDTDPQSMRGLLTDWAQRVRAYSGHGGYCFTYNFMERQLAFSQIYRYARRFWGVDVEYLNVTLPLMDRFIKGVQWLTFLGGPLLQARGDVELDFASLSSSFNIHEFPTGHLLSITDRPIWGDRNQLHRDLDPYFEAAQKLAPFFPDKIPDQFPGTFAHNDVTLDWIRRFVDPDAW